jgi:antitoxin MazE
MRLPFERAADPRRAVAAALAEAVAAHSRIYIVACISIEPVQVSKWGNSLALRLPAAIVEALGLVEGDEIEVEIAGPRHFRVKRDARRTQALERLKALNWPLPPGFSFSREDANER